jgi:two-component system sensor histidine kinase/response regulator
MGGRPWPESEEECGTTFHFTACLGVLPGPAARPDPVSPVDVRQLPVLVVDDNTTNRRLLHDLLTHWQMSATTVDGGQAALTALAQAKAAGRPFRLVLLDAQVPEMDGFETTAAIRAQERVTGAHLPIIALTAHAMSGDHERCLAAGMDGYPTKPLNADDLEAAIDRVLG